METTTALGDITKAITTPQLPRDGDCRRTCVLLRDPRTTLTGHVLSEVRSPQQLKDPDLAESMSVRRS